MKGKNPEAEELFRTMHRETRILARSLFERDKQRASSQPNILLVLGKSGLRETIEGMLKNQSCSVSVAYNTEEGKKMLSANSYDAVITDDSVITNRIKGEERKIIFVDSYSEDPVKRELTPKRKLNLSRYSVLNLASNNPSAQLKSYLDDLVASSKPTKPEPEYHPQKVLIVEDNEKVAESYKQVLEDEGHNVFWVNNEEDAVYAVAEFGINFVAADHDFDKTQATNGLTLLEKIRAYYPHVPVVIQTGKQGEEFKKIESQARRYGAYKVIQKSGETAVKLVELVKKAQLEYHSKIKVDTQPILDDLKVPEKKPY